MNHRFVCLFLITALLQACTSDSTQTETAVSTDTLTTPPAATEETEIRCYVRKTDKDTVTLVMQTTGEVVTGKLAYKLYEKDANTGTFKGTLRQDTLRVAYTFVSEGIESVREVVFLQQGDELWEATGAMEEKAGKMIFSEHTTLQFPENLRLKKNICEE